MTNAMNETRSGSISIARWVLATLALLFVAGALGQFFLVGLGMFEDATRWQDHASLGNALSLLTWLMWIPAVIGKAGRRVILGTLLLFVLFGAQHAFINVDSGVMNALHPLNGSVLLMLGLWIAQQAVSLARVSAPQGSRHPATGAIGKETA
jgi:hypothetical protein